MQEIWPLKRFILTSKWTKLRLVAAPPGPTGIAFPHSLAELSSGEVGKREGREGNGRKEGEKKRGGPPMFEVRWRQCTYDVFSYTKLQAGTHRMQSSAGKMPKILTCGVCSLIRRHKKCLGRHAIFVISSLLEDWTIYVKLFADVRTSESLIHNCFWQIADEVACSITDRCVSHPGYWCQQ